MENKVFPTLYLWSKVPKDAKNCISVNSRIDLNKGFLMNVHPPPARHVQHLGYI